MSLNILSAEKTSKTDLLEEDDDVKLRKPLELMVSSPEVHSDLLPAVENIAIEEMPSADFVHRCTFAFPNEQNFISNQFQHAKGMAMSVLWDKYSDENGTHERGEKLYEAREKNNPNTQKYIGFTRTIIEKIRSINSKNNNEEIMYYVDIIHCPDDGIAVDIAHAHIQMLDSEKKIPTTKISKNHRLDLVDQIMHILNDSDLITKAN